MKTTFAILFVLSVVTPGVFAAESGHASAAESTLPVVSLIPFDEHRQTVVKSGREPRVTTVAATVAPPYRLAPIVASQAATESAAITRDAFQADKISRTRRIRLAAAKQQHSVTQATVTAPSSAPSSAPNSDVAGRLTVATHTTAAISNETPPAETVATSVLASAPPCLDCIPTIEENLLFVPTCPAWELGSELLVLERSGGSTQREPTLCSCNEIQHNRPSDYRDWDTGIRLWARREAPACGTNIELDGWIAEGWGQRQFRTGPQVALGQTIGDGETTTLYDSQLASAEINFSRYFDNWTEFLIGARWVRLDEEASVNASGTIIPSLFQGHDIRNDMYGGHAGVRTTVFDNGGYFTATVTAKGGVLANMAERQTVGLNPGFSDDNTTSFVGDLQIRGRTQLSNCWSFDVGYNFFWLSDVALAIDQFFDPAIRSDSSFFAHGFTFGLTRTW